MLRPDLNFPLLNLDGTETYRAPKNNPGWEQAAVNYLANNLAVLSGKSKVPVEDPDGEVRTLVAYLKQVNPQIP